MIDYYPLVLLALGIFTIFALILWLRVNAFIGLISAALLIGLLSPGVIRSASPQGPSFDVQNSIDQVALAFGDMMYKIGITIAMATVIGKALMDSGAADRIVRALTRLFGEKRASLALLMSGFILSIPVFFDNVFFLLVPLARALRARTGKNYLLYLLAIGAGGAITHSLVPPTPGPIMMAETLRVDMGATIIIGILVGAPLAFLGYLYGHLANRLWNVPLRQVGEVTVEELEQQALRPESELPTLFWSVTPIILPVILIGTFTIFKAVHGVPPNIKDQELVVRKDQQGQTITVQHGGGAEEVLVKGAKDKQLVLRPDKNGQEVTVKPGKKEHEVILSTKGDDPVLTKGPSIRVGDTKVTLGSVLAFLGDPKIALSISALIALIVVIRKRNLTRQQAGALTGSALSDGAMILLITCAGGSFGAMLKAAGVGESLKQLGERGGIDVLVMAWGMAVLLKIAQGSGTVAMATTATMIGAQSNLGYDPVYLVMAIGAGSLVGSWMNDSGFWVVGKLGGMTEGETLKTWTVTLIIMGIAGLPLIYGLTQIVPFPFGR